MKRIIILRASSKSRCDLNLMAKQSPRQSKVKGSVLASTAGTALDKMAKESFNMVESFFAFKRKFQSDPLL